MPPVLLISDSASNLYYGMFNHPFFAGTQRILQAIRETAAKHMTLFELDGATGNERLFNYFLSSHVPGELIDMIKCRNHQSNLIEGSLVVASSLPSRNLLSMFYSLTHFLRNSGQWLRLKQAYARLIFDSAVVGHNACRDEQEAYSAEHANELRDFLESSDRVLKSISRKGDLDSPSEQSNPKRGELKRRLDNFFAT